VVWGPNDEDNVTLNGFHFGFRAEDFVVDSQSDGANKSSLLLFVEEVDADNSNKKITAGHAAGIVMVDATPALATSMGLDNDTTAVTIVDNVNKDSKISVAFDQSILDDSLHPEYTYLDLHGDDYVYRLDIDDNTMVRGWHLPDTTGGTLNTDEAVGDASITFTEADLDVDQEFLLAGSKIFLKDSEPAFVNADATAGANTVTLSSLQPNQVVAEGSIIQIGKAETAHRYRVVDDGANNGYVKVAATGIATFTVTPALRSNLLSGRDAILEKSSMHVVTANAQESAAAANQISVDLYPTLPSDYDSQSTEVFIVDGISDNGTTAYSDVFGMSTGEFSANSVTATTTISGSTMTIEVSDISTAGFVTGEAVDMGAFFNDLSHTSAASVSGTVGTTPEFYANYEDLQDTNHNSWSKVDVYDNYDNGRSPLIIGTDNLVPKLADDGAVNGAVNNRDTAAGFTLNANTNNLAGNTFLYDVTAASNITLIAAHGNDDYTTDDDIIFTYDAAAIAPGDNEDDYPLYYFWGYDTTNSNSALGVNTGARAVLKLAGVTTINTTNTQSYFYSPEAVDIEHGALTGAASSPFTAQCQLSQVDIEQYIHATPAVAVSSASTVGATGTTLTSTSVSRVGSVVTADTKALIVGIPGTGTYNPTLWDKTTDKLVIEDILLDGVGYTLHFSIPQYTTTTYSSNLASETSANTLPAMKVYRKVQVAGMDLLSSTEGDVCSTGNLQAGQKVDEDYNPTVVFNTREHLNEAPTVTFHEGGDVDSTVAKDAQDDRVDYSSPKATVADVGVDSSAVTAKFTVENGLTDMDAATANSGENVDGYIGHGATVTFSNISDYAANKSSFVMTLNLGHGHFASDILGDNDVYFDLIDEGAIDEDGLGNAGDGTADVVDPILNVISGTAVE
jgi:hypothetical protein